MAVTDPLICHMVVILASLNGLNGQKAQQRNYQVKEHSSEDVEAGYYGVSPPTASDGGFPVGFGEFSSFFDKSDSPGFGGAGTFGTGGNGGFPSVGFFPFEIESRNSGGGLKPVLPSSTFWMGPPPSLSGVGIPQLDTPRPQQNSGEDHSGEDGEPGPPPRDWSGEEDGPEREEEESSRQWSSDEAADDGPPPPTGPYRESPSTRSSLREPAYYSRPQSRPHSDNRLSPNPLRPYYKTIVPTKPPQIHKSYLKPHPNGPYRGQPVGRPGSPREKLRVHQHSFGIRHDYPPKSDSSHYSGNTQRRTETDGRNQKSGLFYNFPSSGWDQFRPSPPDYFRDDLDRISDVSDFTPEHSHVNPKKVKSEKQPTPKTKESSCLKSNKTITTKSPEVTLECFICTDGKSGKIYEECREEKPKNDVLVRHKRDVANSTDDSDGRQKRQYEYESEEYTPVKRDYRFGPDHFSGEDFSYEEDVSFDRDRDISRDSEKCWKKRKGEMICISCENMRSGGTYEQCSYASDPKKNAYETSYSKSYGSSRGKNGHRRQQNPGSIKRRPQSRAPSAEDESPDISDPHPPRGLPKRRQYTNKSVSSQEELPERVSTRPSKRRGASNKQYSASTRNGPIVRENYERWTAARRSQPSAPIHVPPPSSRAYSTPPPIGPDPFSLKLPDPYNPPDAVSVDVGYDEDDEVPPPSSSEHYRSSKNRKYDFDDDYDTPFNFFPGLSSSDSDPISIAPHVDYDDATDDDYPAVPSRRIGQGQMEYSMKQAKISKPTGETEETKNSYDVDKNNSSFNQRHNNVTCKKVKKEKMMCLQCAGPHGSRSEECSYIAESEPKSKKPYYEEPRSLNSYESKRNESSHIRGGPNQNEPRGFQQSTPRGVGAHRSGDYQRNNGHHDARFKSNVRPNPDNYQQSGHFAPRSTPPSQSSFQPAVNQHGHYQPNAQASDPQINISDRGKRKFKKYSDDTKKSFGDKESPPSSDSPTTRQRTNPYNHQYNHSQGYNQDRNGSRGGASGVNQSNKSGTNGEGLTRRSYNPVPTDPPALNNQPTIKPGSEKGEYSADTDLTFDPVLGISLPKYMLTKSEHEAIFDEVLGSG